ncbi:MAG: hypothetical protein ACLUOI_11790 [Eisenbergiella sp.]
MKKKVLSMLMGVSILAAALAGCGGSASTESARSGGRIPPISRNTGSGESAAFRRGKDRQFWHCMSGTTGFNQPDGFGFQQLPE